MIDVSRIPIWRIILLFVLYIVLHVGLLMFSKKMGERAEKEKWDEDAVRVSRIMKFVATWFPAIYIVFLMLLFYS